MIQVFNAGATVVALCAMMGTAVAAPDEAITETRPVDARVTRVQLDGVIDLKLRQGAVAKLVINGEPRMLAKTTTAQNGETLIIGTESRGFKINARANSLHAELTLPQLREVRSDSVGFTDISGFSGDQLTLSLDGAGSMKVTCNYRIISASLGGVGSMNLQGVSSEGVDLTLQGAGYVSLNGSSKWLKASLAGLGGLDAQHFRADTVTLELTGLGNATVSARQDAILNLSGMGSVTVYGQPKNRRVSVDGLGKVTWK